MNDLPGFLDGLRFAHPWILWTLLLLPLHLGLRLWLLRRDRVPFGPLQYPMQGPDRRRFRGARWYRFLELQRLPLEALLVAVLVVAAAGPYRESRVELWEDEGVDVLLVLDVSLSMLAEDFPPDRLTALRGIARDFIARSGSNRLGLVIFAKDTYVQSPLTTDHPALLSLLESVTVYTLDQNRSGGTAIGDALVLAADRLGRVREEGRGQAVVLITDGESNEGLEPNLAARYLRDSDIHFYAIGVGGPEPVGVTFEGEPVGGEDDPYLAYLDDSQLREMARLAEGRYYRADNMDALEAIFQELSRLESAPLEKREWVRRRSQGRLLALPALGLFSLVLALGGLLRRPLR